MHCSESKIDLVTCEPPKSHLELSEAFRDFDSDMDGRIDFVEFACLLAAMRLRISNPLALAEFLEIDRDGDGFIVFREFLSWWRARR
jgi:Ca2+-binding EF-hand superfamily protein